MKLPFITRAFVRINDDIKVMLYNVTINPSSDQIGLGLDEFEEQLKEQNPTVEYLGDGDFDSSWEVVHCSNVMDGDEWIFIDQAEVMISSGWKDKNGRDIFLGDEVELTNDAGVKVKVICHYGMAERDLISLSSTAQSLRCELSGFYFKSYMGHSLYPIVNNYAGVHDTQIMEVVGNIYGASLIDL